MSQIKRSIVLNMMLKVAGAGYVLSPPIDIDVIGLHVSEFPRLITSTFRLMRQNGLMFLKRLVLSRSCGEKYLPLMISRYGQLYSHLRTEKSSNSPFQKIPFPKKRRTYFAIWKQHLQSQGQNFPAGTEGSFFERGANPWFRVWCEEYEIMEKRVEFLRECTKKLEVDQGILLEYALKEESYVEM